MYLLLSLVMSSWLRYMHGELVNDDGDCGISGDCESGQESSRPRSNDGANTLISGSILVLRLRTYVHLIRSNFLVTQNVHFHNFHFFFSNENTIISPKMKTLWKQHLNEIHYCELPPIIFYVKLYQIFIDFDWFWITATLQALFIKDILEWIYCQRILSTKAAFNQTNFEEMQILQRKCESYPKCVRNSESIFPTHSEN